MREKTGPGSARGKPTLSVVVPFFNEAPFIPEVFRYVTEAIQACALPYELIFVDDGSEDETWSVLNSIARKHAQVRAIGFSRNFGKEAALSAGLEASRGQAVIIMDGDLEHPPALIPAMVSAWRNGQGQIIEAVKLRRSDGLLRGLRANSFYAFLKFVSGIDLKNATDFKLLDRSVVRAWQTMPERNLFFRGMINWLGFSRYEIPFEVPARIGGETRWSIWKLISLALLGVTAYTTYPLRLMSFAGFVFLGFAAFLTLQTLYQKFFGGAGSGFTTVIILILVTGSAIMIGLGIIGEYLARIYEELKGRPRYIVARQAGSRPGAR